MKRVRAHIERVQGVIREHESADYFRGRGIDVVIGNAAFSGERTFLVNGTEYSAKKIVLATGTTPRELAVPGVADATIHTNESIFTLDRLPGRLVVIGGGPIGVELGQAFAMLGSEVSIVSRDTRLLPREDEEVSAQLQEQLEERGVHLYFGSTPKEFQGRTRLIVALPGGAEHQIGYDACLLAIGRVHDFAGMELGAAGIGLDERGKLIVNEYLETTNPHVYAIGDAAGAHQFTHAAELHASLVLKNLFKPRFLRAPLDTRGMGWVTFTDPEIATFGRSAETLTTSGISCETLRVPFSGEDRAITDENRDGLMKLHVDTKGTILGGTIAARGAGEIVGELMLATTHGMTLEELFERVYPYPTTARITRLAAQQFVGRKLTPGNTRMLRALYRLFS
ncbi:FAD-dependent oxidoreductase [Patescibacteria group bacterium]|jgi:pyruvate/2-oxoglutarate dehydrogenase complex dihydrolipoamide dehydrogenase (E3) component|nr:FAD-dependent oxidoreductase [Patescibacteria group bacterium]